MLFTTLVNEKGQFIYLMFSIYQIMYYGYMNNHRKQNFKSVTIVSKRILGIRELKCTIVRKSQECVTIFVTSFYNVSLQKSENITIETLMVQLLHEKNLNSIANFTPSSSILLQRYYLLLLLRYVTPLYTIIRFILMLLLSSL